MTRAAFLPSIGDPFVLLHTVKYFEEVWQDEVDKLYINIASVVGQGVVKNLASIFAKNPKIKFSSVKTGEFQHGDNINYMLEQCEEDYILLIEDDSIIFKKGEVGLYFELMERDIIDMAGSPRMSCHPKLADIVQKKFGLDYSGYGDKGPAYWPCFLWVKRSDLLKTDRNFNVHLWTAGEDKVCGELAKVDMVGDTFVHTSIQLRELGLRILDVPQYHCNPNDQSSKGSGLGIFDKKCGYMHFGSLSSGIRSYLFDDNDVPLKDREMDPFAVGILVKHNDPSEKMEMVRRIVWWKEALKCDYPVGEFRDLYKKAIDKFQKFNNISDEDVNRQKELYMEIINEHYTRDSSEDE